MNRGGTVLLLIAVGLFLISLFIPAVIARRGDIPAPVYECAGAAAREHVYTDLEWIFAIRGYTLTFLPEKADFTFIFFPVSYFGIPFPPAVVRCDFRGGFLSPVTGWRVVDLSLLVTSE